MLVHDLLDPCVQGRSQPPHPIQAEPREAEPSQGEQQVVQTQNRVGAGCRVSNSNTASGFEKAASFPLKVPAPGRFWARTHRYTSLPSPAARVRYMRACSGCSHESPPLRWAETA